MADKCPRCGGEMRAIARLGCYGCAGCGYWEEWIEQRDGAIIVKGHTPASSAPTPMGWRMP